MMRSARTHQVSGQLIVGAPEPAWAGESGARVLARAFITVAGARYDVDGPGRAI